LIVKKANDKNNNEVQNIYIQINSKKIQTFLLMVQVSWITDMYVNILEPMIYAKRDELIKLGEVREVGKVGKVKKRTEIVEMHSLKVILVEESKEVRKYLSLSIAQANENINEGLNKICKKLNLENSKEDYKNIF